MKFDRFNFMMLMVTSAIINFSLIICGISPWIVFLVTIFYCLVWPLRIIE